MRSLGSAGVSSTTREDERFGNAFLERIVDWLIDEFGPIELYGEEVVLAAAVPLVERDLMPDEIFDAAALASWAEDNGYVKAE